MIILEGVDGGGKTTLGEMLERDGIVGVVKPSPKLTMPDRPLVDSTLEYIDRYRNDNKVAVDRLLFSELVYGQVMRKSVLFSPIRTCLMLEKILSSASFIVFCFPSINDIQFKKDESRDIIFRIRALWNEYWEWYLICRSLSPHPDRVIRYAWTQKEGTGSYAEISEKIRRSC